MGFVNNNISESERFKLQYEEILQKVKETFKVKNAGDIKISQAKASRILSGKQFDPLILCEMASYCGFDINLNITNRK